MPGDTGPYAAALRAAFHYHLLSTFVWRKRWALVSAFVGLAALLGLQLEALAFVPLLAVAILLYRDAVSWRALLVGLSVFALLLAPYVVHDGLNGWENTRGLVAYALRAVGEPFHGMPFGIPFCAPE